ncbi:MAG TPA: glycoside hydrolase family 13 protein [Pseudonocardiaceae bacterium]|nr:glycoside hydrolase family 13 protein [Pseudonocardiaceae bacterium]
MPRHDWWRAAVIYQVYVRSFADGDGDGIGDLTGVRSRLRYLADLGVDAVWLTPFYRSPMVDGGYDVADYRQVDPLFGTNGDAAALIADAHDLGLRVIVDIVPNHTSDRHPWFVEALAAPPGAPARARYLFRDGTGERGELPPNDWQSVFGGGAWVRVPDGQWYLHLFAPEQPDLNWEHDEVRAEFVDVLRYWLDVGVDGFRIDVAHGMTKAAGLPNAGGGQEVLREVTELPYFDQDGVHEIYRAWRKVLDSLPGERVGVAEAWVRSAERLARYVRPDELHQAFNFLYLRCAWDAAEFRSVVGASIAAMVGVGAPNTWVLSNHDVTRHVTRYGGGAIGHRRARAAALFTLALPGSAYIYQGDELGLPEVVDLPDDVLRDPVWTRSGHTERGRDGCRVPVPWSGSVSPFGFSPPGSAPTWLPQPPDWAQLTVDAQLADPSSMLGLYRGALELRHELSELGDGPLNWLPAPVGVLAFDRGPGFVCTVNITPEAAEINRPGELVLASVSELTELAGSSGSTVVLPPDSAGWWTVMRPHQ